MEYQGAFRKRERRSIKSFIKLLGFVLIASLIFMRLLTRVISSQVVNVKVTTENKNTFLYQCPEVIRNITSLNENNVESIDEFYASEGNDAFDIENYEEMKYDGWTRNFKDNKKYLYEWKSKYFSMLKSGDLIYESACGMGLNLLMTLQILSEELQVTHLKVYGNDYLEKSVEVANKLLGRISPAAMQMGQICKGDSTNLFFVPSGSFDMAFTGYIDQIEDPLNIIPQDKKEENGKTILENMCNAKKKKGNTSNINTLAKAKLAELDQKAQEDWFAKWASEIIRIVRPGGGIVIENIAFPQCDNIADWGGVDKKWWVEAVSKYGWNVDNSSIVTEDSLDERRYHLFMKKLG